MMSRKRWNSTQILFKLVAAVTCAPVLLRTTAITAQGLKLHTFSPNPATYKAGVYFKTFTGRVVVKFLRFCNTAQLMATTIYLWSWCVVLVSPHSRTSISRGSNRVTLRLNDLHTSISHRSNLIDNAESVVVL